MPQIQVGETRRRQVLQVLDEFAGRRLRTPPGDTEWQSSDPNVLSVSASGMVVEITGVAPGVAKLGVVTDANGNPFDGCEEWNVYTPDYSGNVVGVSIQEA